jgi:GTP diphosphokinase / guanosine-3',5'-bis(diphosphate) 3'-diphosphatase
MAARSETLSTLERAIAIAAEAHAGQIDKAGEAYILHPLRLMLSLDSEVERKVAVLHDVVEDSGITLEQLRSEGFGEDVLNAIEALTKRDGESKMDAAARAKRNPIALRVKLADNADNQDMTRLGDLTDEDRERLAEYRRVREFLLSP